MWKKIAMLALAAAALQSPLARAGQVMMGLGPFNFAEDGVDLHAGYLPDGSRWLYGYRYVRYTEKDRDPFTGRLLTKTTDTTTGPLVKYLFRPHARGTPYVGAGIYRWSRRERSQITGEVGSDSTVAPFIGGGFMGWMGKSFYYNAGLLIGPGAKLHTSTSVSSEDRSGGFDLQLHLGIAF